MGFFSVFGGFIFWLLFVFCFLVCFLAVPLGSRDLSSPTRDWKRCVLTTGPPGNSLILSFKSFVCHNAVKCTITCYLSISNERQKLFTCLWVASGILKTRLRLDKARDPSETGHFTANSRLKKRHGDTGWRARKLGNRGNKRTGNREEGESSPPVPLNQLSMLWKEPELST